MLEQQRLCSDTADAARAKEFREGNEQVDRQEERIAHASNIITPVIARKTAPQGLFGLDLRIRHRPQKHSVLAGPSEATILAWQLRRTSAFQRSVVEQSTSSYRPEKRDVAHLPSLQYDLKPIAARVVGPCPAQRRARRHTGKYVKRPDA